MPSGIKDFNPDICYSIGRQAGDANMRREGRSKWNGEDGLIAAIETQKALDACGHPMPEPKRKEKP